MKQVCEDKQFGRHWRQYTYEDSGRRWTSITQSRRPVSTSAWPSKSGQANPMNPPSPFTPVSFPDTMSTGLRTMLSHLFSPHGPKGDSNFFSARTCDRKGRRAKVGRRVRSKYSGVVHSRVGSREISVFGSNKWCGQINTPVRMDGWHGRRSAGFKW